MPKLTFKQYQARQKEILAVLLPDYRVTEIVMEGHPIVTLQRLSDGFIYKPSPCANRDTQRFQDAGYFTVALKGLRGNHLVHRLVWMLTHKKMIPYDMEIDHADPYIHPVTGKNNNPSKLGLRTIGENRGLTRKKPISRSIDGRPESSVAGVCYKMLNMRPWVVTVSARQPNGKHMSFTGGSWLYEADAYRARNELYATFDRHLRLADWRQVRDLEGEEDCYVVHRETGRLIAHGGDSFVLNNPAHITLAEWWDSEKSERTQPVRSRGRQVIKSIYDYPEGYLSKIEKPDL